MRTALFSSMAGGVLFIPCLIILPVLFAVFIGIGFSRDDIIEDEVIKIWLKEGSDYSKDRDYARDLGVSGAISTLLAMSSSRDSENIMTEDRLEAIRQRMEAVENVTVVHNNETFTWNDICASNNAGLGTVYKFPCARLTPMDFFSEANWFMNEAGRLTWYDSIKENLVGARIGKFGTMINSCSSGTTTIGGALQMGVAGSLTGKCDALIADRLSTGDNFQLFSDLTNLEKNDPCRICYETKSEESIDGLYAYTKGTLFPLLGTIAKASIQALDSNDPDYASMVDERNTVSSLIQNITVGLNRAKIEEYLTYYTIRAMYALLGAEPTTVGYTNALNSNQTNLAPLSDNPGIRSKFIQDMLYDHADAEYSSLNTAGMPFLNPSQGWNVPFGGSGVDLSGNYEVLLGQLVQGILPNYNTDWSVVENDPIYKWFVAGEEEVTESCGNAILVPGFSRSWCTKHQPIEAKNETRQEFAKMWYNLLVDSYSFLNIVQGTSDPYTWTTGEGCDYGLKGSRASYTNKTDEEILKAASGKLYYIDEGSSSGPLDLSLLMGGVDRSTSEVSTNDPFKKVTSIQTIYPTLLPSNIPDRVKNCNRPQGPVNITEEDAEEILTEFKKSMVEEWSKGWNDDNDGEVQFTAFFDGRGVGGTFAFVLRDITDDNGKLTAIAIIIIVIVSTVFLASSDPIQSKVLLTFCGVALVVVAFFGSLGLAIMLGIKININIAWTLPFIIIGLGVDDMYIVLLALKKQRDYEKENFIDAMKEVIVPVTMTSLVNASMFAVMNFIDIGVVYKTAQAALIAVIFLYLTIILCFPAYCYLDMKRQRSGQCDVLVCKKVDKVEHEGDSGAFLFNLIYKPLMLSDHILSKIVNLFVVVATLTLVIVGIVGITQRQKGLGISEFFPTSHQANRWAELRADDLAAWAIGISWGALDYTNPDTQLKMMKQYEDVIDTQHVAAESTEYLWIADFNLWASSQCDENFAKDDSEIGECGIDQEFATGDTCSGEWVNNTYGLRTKSIANVFADSTSDTCGAIEGICLHASQMMPDDLTALNVSVPLDVLAYENVTYCPVVNGWSEEKLAFCIKQWRYFTGGSGGILVEENNATIYNSTCEGEFLRDSTVKSPIKYSSSPGLYGVNLGSHDKTLQLIKETRKICDENDEIHCWMTGIPFDYWEQYLDVDEVLLKAAALSVAVGFGVSTIFLLLQLKTSRTDFGLMQTIMASFVGGFLIALTCILCLIPVVGLSVLFNVNITAFSNMAFVLSIGFAVEYSVHVVHRFLSAPYSIKSAADRVEHTMEFLFLPLTLSFISSTIGVVCLAFTEFAFNERFFFRPLMVVMLVTYFFGTYFLPVVLRFLDVDFLKVGSVDDDEEEEEKEVKKSSAEFHDDEA